MSHFVCLPLVTTLLLNPPSHSRQFATTLNQRKTVLQCKNRQSVFSLGAHFLHVFYESTVAKMAVIPLVYQKVTPFSIFRVSGRQTSRIQFLSIAFLPISVRRAIGVKSGPTMETFLTVKPEYDYTAPTATPILPIIPPAKHIHILIGHPLDTYSQNPQWPIILLCILSMLC